MQFETSSAQLSATIVELIEHMRQAAYDEGRGESDGHGPDEPADDDPGDVLTLLRTRMPSDLGKYYPSARLMLLADDLPAERRREVVRELLADPTQTGGPSAKPAAQ